ncbi:MAG: NAD(P)H-hydrate dehydratase [Verrucomicrobia bacterium]|nr:NAD(P)H-hydrate dehydratase [Verrucomicrobiota bacterium]
MGGGLLGRRPEAGGRDPPRRRARRAARPPAHPARPARAHPRRQGQQRRRCPFTDFLKRKPALIIDGLFGIGLNRPLEDGWAKLVDAVNKSRVPVLAVDVPSGLDADTGLPKGAVIHATVTVTFAAPKRGMVLARAWDVTGRLEVATDLGLLPCPFTGDLQWTLAEDFDGLVPPRPMSAHKGIFGHLVIVAGSQGYHGAAVLAARSALRAMPGLVTLFTTDAVFPIVAGQLQSAMVRAWRGDTKVPDYAETLLFGPGLAGKDVPVSMRSRLRRAWHASQTPVIADASAFDWLPPEPKRLDALRVVTPHPGEAARMLFVTSEAILRDRIGALRELSRRWGESWVVLKGHQTLVGSARGPVFINPSGNPLLAQGGAGDVLAGYLAGLLVQRPFRAAPGMGIRYAVWQHGAAADHLSATHPAWTTEALPDALGHRSPE